MNTYDATEGVEERAGCGGLLHDEHGNWLCGFAQPHRNTNYYLAELWEDWQGLLLVRIKGYSKVDLQLDSMIVVHKFWRQDTWNIQRVL
ncbi:putative ribonuclease H protein [Trifolium medium]|uniref:Putative ribonuclease H protein n=1 Tax=Trifolium medium TaxID=97028 RepID=A0A392M954_9FABA|nr:putative ribonuclease H protein [Trifolium medium]